MIDLKRKYGKKYRIIMEDAWYVETAESNPDKVKDKPWYYVIIGKYGTIYLHGVNKLAVMITANRVKSRILAEYHDILELYVEAEDESIFFFNPASFEIVASLIKARKKKRLSAEHKAKLVKAGSNFRFSTGIRCR